MTLDIKVGQEYPVSEIKEHYHFVEYIKLNRPDLKSKYGEFGAILRFGEDSYLVGINERKRLVIIEQVVSDK